MTDDELELPSPKYRVEEQTVSVGETFETGFGATDFHIEGSSDGFVTVRYLVPENLMETREAEIGTFTDEYLETLEDHVEEMEEQARDDRTNEFRYDPDEDE